MFSLLTYESFNSGKGLVDMSLVWTNRNCYVANYGSSLFTTNAFFQFQAGLMYQLYFYQSNLRFMIAFVTATVVALIVGGYTTWTISLRLPIIVGFASLVVFNALMSTARLGTSTSILWGYPVLAGVALSTVFPLAITIVQLSLPHRNIGVATALAISIFGVGTGITGAVNSSILAQSIEAHMPGKVATAVLPYGYPMEKLGSLIGALGSGDPETVAMAVDGNFQLIPVAVQAYADGHTLAFRNVYIAAACFSGVGLIAACLFKNSRPTMLDNEDEDVMFGTPSPEEAKDDDAPQVTRIETIDV